MFWVFIRSDSETLLMSTHNMFSWRNKKTIDTLTEKKQQPYLELLTLYLLRGMSRTSKQQSKYVTTSILL